MCSIQVAKKFQWVQIFTISYSKIRTAKINHPTCGVEIDDVMMSDTERVIYPILHPLYEHAQKWVNHFLLPLNLCYQELAVTLFT